MPIRGPGIANQIEYGIAGQGDVVMGTGDTMTLSQDMYCDSLTMTDNADLNTNGYRIYITGKLMMSGSTLIHNSGQGGASGDSAGTGGLGAPLGTLAGGWAGGDGHMNANGSNGTTDPANTSAAFGFSSGKGGNATNTGGAAALSDYDLSVFGDFTGSPIFAWRGLDLAGGNGANVVVAPSGGAGGGGGAGSSGGTGGGGGGGGGIIHISAFEIELSESANILTFGGDGGDGSAAGDGGGGGGGQGGAIAFHCDHITVTSDSQVLCPHGSGGNHSGAGADGDPGEDGNIFVISERGTQTFVSFLNTGTWPQI